MAMLNIIQMHLFIFLHRIGAGDTLELKVNAAYGPVSITHSADNAEGVYDTICLT